MTIEERIENLTKQQENAKEVFIKCQGAIEYVEQKIKDKDKEKKKSDK